MLERCWRAQWAGLDEVERKMVDLAWSQGTIPHGYEMRDKHCHTLWMVDYPRASILRLITIKS